MSIRPILLLVSFAILGCNKTADPSLAPVSGTITLNDQPLAYATVTFIPKDGTPGFGGAGKTDASGKYTIVGSRNNEKGNTAGRVPGGHQQASHARWLGMPPDDNTPPMMSPAKESLPDSTSSMTSTKQTASVPAGGGSFDFAVVHKKK